VTITLVTGVSGSGKSAVSRALAAQGEQAISLDAYPGLCAWLDAADAVVSRPDHPSLAWLRTHRWCWRPDVLDLDRETMLARLDNASRGNDFGRAGESRALLIENFDGHRAQLLDSADLVVDANRPMAEVVQQIHAGAR